MTDVLVHRMRYTEEMRGMLGAREFAALRPGAYVINVARGGIVNGEALYQPPAGTRTLCRRHHSSNA
jgi:phosphoglycerate dehydrogenase-like enzyme